MPAIGAGASLAAGKFKVVFTSGYARTAVHKLGLLEINAHILPKPFRIDSLARLLRTALDEA